MATESAAYRLLREWIAVGTPWGADDAPSLVGIAVEPAEKLLAVGQTQSLAVVARYSDGTSRDVDFDGRVFLPATGPLAG